METAQSVLEQKAHQEAPGTPQSHSDDIEKKKINEVQDLARAALGSGNRAEGLAGAGRVTDVSR